MDGIGGTTIKRVLGPRAANFVLGTGRFQPNGASDPLAASFQGTLAGLFAVTRQGVGLWRVAFTPVGFKFKVGQFPLILIQNSMSDVTNTHRFQAVQVGEWDNTNRRFSIQALQTNAAFEVPNNADNWVGFALLAGTAGR